MFVIVVGGGKVGSHLTTLLLSQGHKVRLIDNRTEVLARLHRELPTEVIYTGDSTDPHVLEEAGIRDCQVLAAVLGEDEANLVTTSLAKFEYGVPRVIGRVNDPRNAWLYNKDMGVDVSLNQADVFAHLVEEEMSLGDMMTLLKLRRGAYSVVEEKLPRGARAIGVALKDLHLPDSCSIAAIIRDGKIVIPRGITTLQEGDEVLAVVDAEGARQLSRLLGFPDRQG